MSIRVFARRAALSALTLALAACATQAPPPVASKPAAAPPRMATAPGTDPLPEPLPAMPLAEAKAAFVRDTAARYGVDPAYIESVLAGAELREGIIAAMSRPAEAKPWSAYRPIFMTATRIDGGRAFLASHRDALLRVQAQTGVPAEVIVAIIGVETNFGGNAGSYPVVDALYTLAFAYPRSGDPGKADRENRREAFFRGELAQLFALGKEEGLDITALKGSYAGAMGWGQFMPSSYREFAVDGNGDGKRDLFASTDDVFASIANYFARKGGWVRDGVVTVRANRDANARDIEPESLDPVYPMAELAARGFRPLDAVPAGESATVLRFEGDAGPEYWFGFRNFYAITRYNISKHYAMAVYQLAEAIAGRGAVAAPAAVPPPTVPAPVVPNAAPAMSPAVAPSITGQPGA